METKVKKILFVFFVFWSSAFMTVAQHRVEREKVTAMKVGFLTKEMNLTVDEAERFWPIYHEHQKKKDALFQEKRQLMENIKNKKGEITQKDLDDFIEKKFALKEKEIQLEREFYDKIKKILPPEKVLSYYRAEVKFKHFVMERLREESGPRHHHGPHHGHDWERD